MSTTPTKDTPDETGEHTALTREQLAALVDERTELALACEEREHQAGDALLDAQEQIARLEHELEGVRAERDRYRLIARTAYANERFQDSLRLRDQRGQLPRAKTLRKAG